MATSSAFAAMKPASPPGPCPPHQHHHTNPAPAERGQASRSLARRLSSALAPPAKSPSRPALLRSRPFPAALLALVTLLTAACALSITALVAGHSGRILHYKGRVVKVSLGGSAPITLDESALSGRMGPVKTGYSRYENSPGQFTDLSALSPTANRLGIALAVFLAISAAASAASAVGAALGYRGRPLWAIAGVLIPFTLFGLLVATYLSSLAALAGGIRARAGGFLGGLVQADVSAMQHPGLAWACTAAACAAWLCAVLAALLVPRGG